MIIENEENIRYVMVDNPKDREEVEKTALAKMDDICQELYEAGLTTGVIDYELHGNVIKLKFLAYPPTFIEIP